MNEVRLDSLGRAIHPNRWKGLVKFQFQPGQSGNPRGALTHGMSGTREYRVWLSMKNRCYNSLSTSWKYYGGRGITVEDPRWLDCPNNLLADLGPCPPGHMLMRTDNERGYCKANCKWATRKQQADNRRARIKLLAERVRIHAKENAAIVAVFGQICDEGNWREISHHRIARVASKILGREITPESARKSMLSLGGGKGGPDFRTPSSASVSLSRCSEPATRVIASATPSRGLGVPDPVPGGTNIPARPGNPRIDNDPAPTTKPVFSDPFEVLKRPARASWWR
jgi:hypothetical protein